ncbi:mitomycin resistance protein [Chitinimonas arctica]|uniref:Mitomycin resistance protein n=1 Tax=Chitinimonas arctica TaxID=2594795 RepID=A0A516SLS7_9NEIS|nr:helix-hairpin-helix domain-containing protein [Chitinimonas arctica]QDQ29099.1 mitomycin resistance protein [Chitinimonas arctica]
MPPKRHGMERLEDLPGVGPSLAADLRSLGIGKPAELVGRDPIALYHELCLATGQRHDPCVADVFMAAVHFAGTGEARNWWTFTAERKTLL